MDEEELYITCVCGALVREENVCEHVDECLREEFIKNSVSLRINKSGGGPNQELPKERYVCCVCLRCGHPMSKNQGTLITFNPSAHKNFFTSCRYKCNPQSFHEPKVCKTCKLAKDFHQNAPGEEDGIPNCIDGVVPDKPVVVADKKETKCRQRKVVTWESLLEDDLETDADGWCDDVPEHDHSVIVEELPSGPPCKQLHVALLPDYSNIGNEDSTYQNYSLILQILDTSPPAASVDTQTDLVATENVGVQVKIMGVYPEEVEKLLAEDRRYTLPEFDPTAEAAYRSHLKTLIPCTHCSRTFSPDRIQKHISCCIERPKTREYAKPPDGEIKR